MERKATRLSKIAREFNVGISTIIEFLRKQGYQIESNPNSKIPPDLYDKINEEYGGKFKVVGRIDLSNFITNKESEEVVGRIDTKHEICNYINKEFKQLIETSIEYKHLLIDKSIFDLIDSLNLRKNVLISDNEFHFNPEFEELLFSSIFAYKPLKEIYHYTTLEACFNILLSGKIRMTSIAALNDRLEVNFNDVEGNQGLSDIVNHKYILSCTSGLMKDNLNSWRLYGNDGNGISIGFKLKKEIQNDFFLGQIFYGNEVYNAIRNIKNYLDKKGINLELKTDYWKSFIKSMDYEYENEIRVYYNNPGNINKNWYINRNNLPNSYVEFDLSDFPLEISEIWIGPCINEQKILKFQLEQLIKELNSAFIKYNIDIKISQIDHYRRMH